MKPLDFATLATRFPGVPDATTRLEELRWQTRCAPSVHLRPAAGHGHQLAGHERAWLRGRGVCGRGLPFFSYARTVGTQLPGAGDPAWRHHRRHRRTVREGTEYTLYLSTGRLLFRVSAVAAEESPQADVEYVMTALMVKRARTPMRLSRRKRTTPGGSRRRPRCRRRRPGAATGRDTDAVEDQIACMSTPSQCSLQRRRSRLDLACLRMRLELRHDMDGGAFPTSRATSTVLTSARWK